MKEVLTLIGVVALAAAIWVLTMSLWYLRGQSDKKLLDANDETIKSLQDMNHAKEDIIAKNKNLLDAGNVTIKSLQDTIQTDADTIGKDKADFDAKDETIKSLQNDIQTKEDMIGKDKADLVAKDETIKSLEDAIASYQEQAKEILQANETKESEDNILEKVYPKDNGFDAQNLGAGFFAYQYFGKAIVDPNHNQQPDRIPNHTPWKFSGNAGIAANNSGFYLDNAANQDSNGDTSTSGQAGFLQFKDSSISQLVRLPAGTYTVTFDYEARRDYQPNQIAVSIDDTVLFEGTPTDNNTFKQITTRSISLKTTGKHSLMFHGLDGDTTFIDNICINRITSKAPGSKKGGPDTNIEKAHHDSVGPANVVSIK